MQTSASLIVTGAGNPTCFHCSAEVSNFAANIWGRGSAPKPTGAAETAKLQGQSQCCLTLSSDATRWLSIGHRIVFLSSCKAPCTTELVVS